MFPLISKGHKKNINCTMDDVWGYFLGPPHSTTTAAVTTNKNIKMSSFNMFKSSENIQTKEGVSDCTVSNNKFSSVTLNELAMKARVSRL